jgi:hypothetical protein
VARRRYVHCPKPRHRLVRDLPEADWIDVLARLEARMTSEGIKPPEGWQAALARQVGRDDG